MWRTHRPHRPRTRYKTTHKTADLARWTRGRYLWVAGDRAPYAGDDDGQHRPHEIPANLSFTGGAVDAGGILLDLVTEDHTSNHFRSADFDHGPPKPSQTPFKPRRRASTIRGPLPRVTSFISPCRHTYARQAGPSKFDPGSKLLTTPPPPHSRYPDGMTRMRPSASLCAGAIYSGRP
jgi:hypothetical protein